jgi:hypothetical protein
VTTAKKAAAPKKTAASDTTTSAEGTAAADTTTETETETESGPGVSVRNDAGPGTGRAAEAETTARPPATIVNESPAAAPLDPPADSHTQREPEHGHKGSSTDQTYAEVGGQTIAGENHVRLVDADGNTVSPDSLFNDVDPKFTYVEAAGRVYEEFTYPNTKRPVKRLLYVEGARVPRSQADRIKAAATADAEAAQDSE